MYRKNTVHLTKLAFCDRWIKYGKKPIAHFSSELNECCWNTPVVVVVVACKMHMEKIVSDVLCMKFKAPDRKHEKITE